MNTVILTKDELLAEKRELINKINGNNHDEILKLLKANEIAIKEMDKIALLKQVNAKYSRLRGMALQAYECEQPTEDITTNDGGFHKVKAKKYPKIAALQYASAKWQDNRLTQLTINGEKFYMYTTKHEYQKETVYTRPATFSEFLAFNTIPEQDITIEQYNAMAEQLTALNTKLQKDMEDYKNGLESLKISSLSYWGLTGQHNVNLYEYLPTVR
jgi:hypothetical protein